MVRVQPVLTVLDMPDQTHEVVLLERHGPALLLQCPLPFAPHTALQLRLDHELLLGEVTDSRPKNSHFEVRMQAQESLADSWNLHSEWNAMDTEESVMGSLVALNAHLAFYEHRRRTRSGTTQHNLKKGM